MLDQVKASEIIVLCVVSIMALAANLPKNLVGNLVDQNLLLIALTITVVIALFRHLKLMLFLTILVLAIGANLPDQLANQLGVNPFVMLAFSGVLVFIALLNKYFEFVPTEKIEDQKLDTIESRRALLTAIIKGDLAALHQLLLLDVEINFSQNGTVPLYLAIEKGYSDIVLLLLSHGAKTHVRNNEGKTPIEFALQHEDVRIAEILDYAAKQKTVFSMQHGIN